MSIYDFTVSAANDEPVDLADFRGRVLLIVNTASKCGFTPQYAGLEVLQQKYGARGFSVLAFPCNQFGAQEPGDMAEIQHFCVTNYQTSFPLFAKINVNGSDADPLYQYLKSSAPGILGSEAIKWNFTKFLINRQGKVLARYAPTTTPESLAQEIEVALV